MQRAVLFLVLGLVFGGLAGWFGPQFFIKETPTPKATSSVPAGFKKVTLSIPGGGLEIYIRETDKVAKLKNEEQIIGYKVFDGFAQQTGAAVDIVTERLTEFYDRPEATDLATYKEAVSGLTLRETREATINGHAALKQLYDATLGQKRSDGAVIKKPVTNLLRYVIDGGNGRFILLKAPAGFQTYLDTVAVSVKFVAAPKTGDENAINLGTDASIDEVLPTENPLPAGGEGIDL
jgi:hypothetical protein